METATGRFMRVIPEEAHLLAPLAGWAEREPDRVLAAYRDGDRFVDVTAGEIYSRVRALAKGLVASGVEPGDRVALMSRTRLEWTLVDYAILAAGAVTVPIYETSSAEQVEWVIEDSGSRLLVAETGAMGELFEGLAGSSAGRGEVLVIDQGGLMELERRGSDVADADLDRRSAEIGPDDLATIVYTSGTTGRPKGCMLTHRNLRTNVWQTLDAIGGMFRDGDVGVLFLPLAHSLGKINALVALEQGIKGVYCSDLSRLSEELTMVRPTMFGSVPRIFEKVFNAAQKQAHDEGHGAVFDLSSEVATKWSRQRSGGGFHPVTEAEHVVFDHLVYRKVRDALGGKLRFSFSGGGPLGERLTHFFNGAGVRILEGYGLTETAPVLTVNRDGAWKPGTVGQPVADTSIRIAADGEIVAKGPQVFRGYWRNEQATEDTFDRDGWFKTGDIGSLDEEGYLRITGRKKELIVTAAGKNVAPAPLEDRLRAHPLISQAVVLGENRPFIAAMIALDQEAFLDWARTLGRGDARVEEAVEDPHLRAALQAAVDDANLSVSRAESIRKFAILPRDLTVADGELTPTLKVRRAVVEQSFASVVEDLYRS